MVPGAYSGAAMLSSALCCGTCFLNLGWPFDIRFHLCSDVFMVPPLCAVELYRQGVTVRGERQKTPAWVGSLIKLKIFYSYNVLMFI